MSNKNLITRIALILTVIQIHIPTLGYTEGFEDLNQDGLVSYIGFGDSITFGVGDGTAVGQFVDDPPLTNGSQGYLERIRTLAGLATFNQGAPGEVFTEEGVFRFPSAVTSNQADYIGILEGANDATLQVSITDYRLALQRAVNVARATGKMPVVITIPPPCCNHKSIAPITGSYSSVARNISNINDVLLADVERAWATTCQNKSQCELWNVPDGLHPNTLGYQVMAETVLATLLEIDIFAPDGPLKLEEVLGLPEGSVATKADDPPV